MEALRFNFGTPLRLPLPYGRQKREATADYSLPLRLRKKCVSLSSAERERDNFYLKSGNGNGFHSDEDEERSVECEVEVISWRERRIKADIFVNSSIQSLWNALTDYERLADFIPNLVSRSCSSNCICCDGFLSLPYKWNGHCVISSGRIPCPHPGRIWLEQRGLQRALYWHIEARVVLDLQELINSDGSRELHFSMVDGDFKKFEGKWSLKSGTRSSPTMLSYEVNVIPRFNFPAIILERIIRSDLPVNLRALACRAEENSKGYRKVEAPGDSIHGASMVHTDTVNDGKGELLQETFRGVTSNSHVGLLSSLCSELSNNWGVFGKVCRLDKHCMVDEVHLRRFDGLLENGGVHRCVIASITVKASVRDVWNVLTAYESLPEIVPNLAISKILSRESNKVRILQEGCKGLLYMVLHARVVLDLCEQHEQDISFEQVEGDFDSLRGKWHLEQLGNHHTLLKYSVESKMHKDTFLSEALMEEVVYEDLPSNLCAIRDSIEKRSLNRSSKALDEGRHSEEKSTSYSIYQLNDYSSTVEEVSVVNGGNTCRPRSKIPGLQRDIEVLKAELLKFISEHGQEGFMPMRKQLRLHGRVDIEKAITRMGGFRRIASLMNLSLAYKQRKPKGYWDKFDNLQEEINRFQRSWGMDPSYMPSRKSFERAGRYDIARALEKWGGLHEVSRLLSLKVRHPNRQPNFAKDRKNDYVALNDDGENKTPSKPYSLDTEKWLTELKHLDINWVE